ncbi:MAG: glucosamine-6-phosphate deaminase [Oscillospiraceae bacterium]|nr:glucosamine-6-phosphate deaminase [Oscillospiraceae bacterium]
MNIISVKDYDALGVQAAKLIAAQVIQKPDCVLGLATGSSPISTYQALIEWYNKGLLDFSKVRTVNLDEYRGLQPTHDQSYAYFMRDNLFDHINIDKANTNIPDGTNPDAEAEAARYEAVIAGLGGIDLQLLGLGFNGHIGFNEPAPEFPVTTHCVDLTDSTIQANKRFFASAGDVPRQAYTMGIRAIMQARRVVMVVSGGGKAGIIKEAFTGPVTPQVPASILQLHPNFTLVADEAALAEL